MQLESDDENFTIECPLCNVPIIKVNPPIDSPINLEEVRVRILDNYDSSSQSSERQADEDRAAMMLAANRIVHG